MTGLLFACSGAFAQQEWKELVVNGDFEGSGFSSFSIKNSQDGSSQDLTADDIVVDDDDANNHCAKVTLTITPRSCHFIIKLAEPLSEGDIFKFSMRAKTSSEKDVPIRTENMGNIVVKTGGEWSTFTYEGVVSSELAGSQAITLSFGPVPRKNDIFYFDDISMKVMDGNAPIEFADAKVKEICVSNWDTSGDGELSYAEAAAVTDSNLGYSFFYKRDITSFDEFQYFIGLSEIGGFRGCSNLNSIVLPCTAKIINSSAFEECASLKTLVIPNSVMYIGQRSFAECTGLTSIEIPNSVIELGRIERDNVTEVGGGTFENCSNLSTVVLSQNLIILDVDIFKGCTSLSSLNIPKSVRWILNNIASGCDNLTSILVEEGNPVYNSRNNCNAIIETETNTLIAGCKNTVIPNTVTSIGSGAFVGCSGLTSITIQKTVTNIGSGAFAGCSGLTSISVESGNTKYDSRNNCKAIIETETNTLIAGCMNTIIPNSVTTIGEGAFSGCGLTSLTIPNSVTSIGGGAFYGCRTLTSVIIPNSVTSIGPLAFMNSGLTSVTIPNSVNTIEYQLFLGCEHLTSVSIPNSVTTIGEFAFWNSGLTSVTIPNSVTIIGVEAFYGCSGLTSVIIPNSVITIGDGAFELCGLTSVTIPNSVTTIGAGAFSFCRALTEVRSMITEPFEIDPYCWAEYGVSTYEFPLYVPVGTKEKYESTPGWNKFKNIVEMEASSGIAIDETNFPDENFRNWVLAQDYGQDGVLTETEIAGVKEIEVGSKSIIDLKGIEYFTALTYLDCSSNQLASLDVSKNKDLEALDCNNNQLTTLDMSNNTALTGLFFSCNQLTSLDVSKNTALKWLVCDNNQLTSLDLLKNTALVELYCYNNQINGASMDALIAGLPSTGGDFFAIAPVDSREQNVVTKAQVTAAKEKGWTTYYWNLETGQFEEYEGCDSEIAPVEQGETIDLGNEIDENTNLDGNVVGDVYYSISSGDGNYDAAEGCLVVTKPTDDSAIDGQDIFGEEFKDNYTGIVFKLAPGKGTIKVEAETQGNMVLKVKIGNSDPIEMELDGKLKVKFPYNVSEPTYVYIYGGMGAAGAKTMGANRAKSAADLLKIYGFEIVSDPSGIDAIENGQQPDAPVYNLNGQRVNTLGKGIYIKNGRKVLMK